MIERLEAIYKRYNELTDMLMSPEVISDIKKTLEITKEQASLKDSYEAYLEYKQVCEDLEAAKEMASDPDMAEFAREEIESLNTKKSELESKIEILLLPKDPNDEKDVIMEIRGAAGGDEGNIFAGDLYRMYTRYAEKQGWHIEVYNEEEGTAGGYAQIEFKIKGDSV